MRLYQGNAKELVGKKIDCEHRRFGYYPMEVIEIGRIPYLNAVYDAQRSPFCFRTAVFRSQRPPIFC